MDAEGEYIENALRALFEYNPHLRELPEEELDRQLKIFALIIELHLQDFPEDATPSA